MNAPQHEAAACSNAQKFSAALKLCAGLVDLFAVRGNPLQSEGCATRRDAWGWRYRKRITVLAAASVALAAFLELASAACHSPTQSSTADSVAQREFERRLARCSPHDADALLALAEWAAAHDLASHADAIYRQILEKQPYHDLAYSALIALAERHELAPNSVSLEQAASLLPASFRRYESRRFVVLSDASASIARQQLEILEQTHHQFQRLARRFDLRPLPLRHKLVCILFSQRTDYEAFAREHDNIPRAWMIGHYSPINDWMAMHDPESLRDVEQARQQLADLQDHLVQLTQQANQAINQRDRDRAEALRSEIAQRQRYLTEQRRRIDQYVQQRLIATAIHETTHLLLFHTKVQGTQVRYPLWISEGLAMCMETDSLREAFGPDRDHAPRRERFTSLFADGALLPLRELLVIDDASTQSHAHQLDVIYHQSYALTMWMCRFRRNELIEYLHLMRTHEPGTLDRDQHLALFEQAFGNIAQLERAWQRYERNLADSMLRAQQ